MDSHSVARPMPLPAVTAGLDHSEEMIAEVDEPPDEKQHDYFWPPHTSKAPCAVTSPYSKAPPPAWLRRESLLTRQLHSETDHTEDEEHGRPPPRGMSMVSTWSNPSTTSTAELTSDDGRSMPSPSASPLLSPTNLRDTAGNNTKALAAGEPRILGLDALAALPKPANALPERTVEVELGRKRCISFACGKKEQPKAVAAAPAPVEAKPASPPKRKCMIKFACPTRTGLNSTEAETGQRATSSPPNHTLPVPLTRPNSEKVHRGSDSTVTHASPVRSRKSHSPIVERNAAMPPPMIRKLSNNSDSGAESTRFHEFANSEEEHEGWVQESTCHRMRLTVNDTLRKENVIRKLTEEAEEEALEEEDADLEDDDLGENDEDEDDDEDDVRTEDKDEDAGADVDDDVESDAGFHSDNEEGFAGSDSEDDGSDYEWWKPGGLSTAATSTDQLEHLATHIRADRIESGSSIDSIDVGRASPRPKRRHPRLRNNFRSHAVQIDRPPTPDLPDSTDFVCGTLDEDRPLEQAYINCMKQREAAKHHPAPQDIDPTFPTSDPEMDEEDDEDIEDAEASESEAMMHGDLEELNATARRKSPMPVRRKSNAHRSPPPAAMRHRSPAPRVKSPAPPRRSTCRSPPPPRGRSPKAGRNLFSHSPIRTQSPLIGAQMTSPPNTRRTSPSAFTKRLPMSGLAARPSHATHTASLPRSGGFLISRMARLQAHDDSDTERDPDAPKKRGAIDIVKGLEKKRLRRREKLMQKAVAKAAGKAEKPYKVKPGKGCERMREVGLELQKYKGKANHILSV